MEHYFIFFYLMIGFIEAGFRLFDEVFDIVADFRRLKHDIV